MNQLRLWLESHLPSFFRPAETTVHVDIAGVELTLRDWEGSNVLAIVPKEILDDDYKLVVRFAGGIGQKTLRARFARLEPA